MAKLYTFGEMRQIINAELEHIDPDSSINNFSIDSRVVKKGEIFFCIKGENTDGHIYISQALERGAGAIVANPESIPETLRKNEFPRLLVADPNLALREWAAEVRTNFKGKVLAVTGSNGKTSTKEILAGLCRYFDPNAYATPGNFNNYIGVPLTLLDAPTEARWWIIEIGSNNSGEIAELSEIVRPTGGIITNIGESHLEFLLNTIGVAQEKSGLFAGMAPGSKVIIPESLLHLDIVEENAKKAGVELIKTRQITEESKGERHTFQLFDAEFETSINNPLFLQNLVSALTLLRSEGLSVPELQQATANLELGVKGRFQQINMGDWFLIDDTYNANPSSFQSVLENMQKIYPNNRKIVVCGKMAELGEQSRELHQQVGENMIKNGVKKMFGFGGEEIEFYLEGWAKGGGNPESAKHFTDLEEITKSFKLQLKPEDVVLVKGSRSAQMERFVEKIK